MRSTDGSWVSPLLSENRRAQTRHRPVWKEVEINKTRELTKQKKTKCKPPCTGFSRTGGLQLMWWSKLHLRCDSVLPKLNRCFSTAALGHTGATGQWLHGWHLYLISDIYWYRAFLLEWTTGKKKPKHWMEAMINRLRWFRPSLTPKSNWSSLKDFGGGTWPLLAAPHWQSWLGLTQHVHLGTYGIIFQRWSWISYGVSHYPVTMGGDSSTALGMVFQKASLLCFHYPSNKRVPYLAVQEISPVIFLHNWRCKLDCIPVFQLSGECGKKIFIALALHDQGEAWLFKDALLMNARGHLPLLMYKWLVTEKCREINSQVLCLLWLFSRCVTLDMGYLWVSDSAQG